MYNASNRYRERCKAWISCSKGVKEGTEVGLCHLPEFNNGQMLAPLEKGQLEFELGIGLSADWPLPQRPGFPEV